MLYYIEYIDILSKCRLKLKKNGRIIIYKERIAALEISNNHSLQQEESEYFVFSFFVKGIEEKEIFLELPDGGTMVNPLYDVI